MQFLRRWHRRRGSAVPQRIQEMLLEYMRNGRRQPRADWVDDAGYWEGNRSEAVPARRHEMDEWTAASEQYQREQEEQVAQRY